MQLIANALSVNLDGWALLTTENPTERVIMEALVHEALLIQFKADKHRANLIAAEVSKLFK